MQNSRASNPYPPSTKEYTWERPEYIFLRNIFKLNDINSHKLKKSEYKFQVRLNAAVKQVFRNFVTNKGKLLVSYLFSIGVYSLVMQQRSDKRSALDSITLACRHSSKN